MKLTKEMILANKGDVYEEYIEEWGQSVPLMPLSDGQAEQVKRLKMTGIKAKGKPGAEEADSMEFDIAEVAINAYEADVLAVACSLTAGMGEAWTVEEVKNLRPQGIVKRLAQVVHTISGMNVSDNEMRSFRSVPGGGGDKGPDGAGLSSGDDSKGLDGAAKKILTDGSRRESIGTEAGS